MSWSLWGLTAMIAFLAQLTGGAGEEALVTFVLGVTPLVVCVLALVTGGRIRAVPASARDAR